MDYQNREIPEGINVSPTHPLVDFIWMMAAVAVAIAVLVFALFLLTQKLLPQVPFSAERAIAERLAPRLLGTQDTTPGQQRLETYLQSLADRLVATEPLPENVVIEMHYVDSDTVNAFATLGGHIVVCRGLLEKLPDENALAMVVGHEIGHVRYRHPLLAAGRGLAVGLALGTLAGASDNTLANMALNLGGGIALRKYGRDQEWAADVAALRAVVALYGHTAGSAALFQMLDAERGRFALPEILRSHPLDAERIAAIDDIASSEGWRKTGASTPLPAF